MRESSWSRMQATSCVFVNAPIGSSCRIDKRVVVVPFVPVGFPVCAREILLASAEARRSQPPRSYRSSNTMTRALTGKRTGTNGTSQRRVALENGSGESPRTKSSSGLPLSSFSWNPERRYPRSCSRRRLEICPSTTDQFVPFVPFVQFVFSNVMASRGRAAAARQGHCCPAPSSGRLDSLMRPVH
jgi:hypothetical protein